MLCALVVMPLLAQDSTKRAVTPTPGRIRGRVVSDSGSLPVEGATVLIPALGRTVRTDSLGRYDLPGLPAGPHQVVVRAVGFRQDSTTVEVRDRLVVGLELRLAYEDIVVMRPGSAPQRLPLVTTKADAPPDSSGKMQEFFDRRRQGVGHFMERSQLAKWSNRRTSEMLETVGGLKVQSGGSKGWVMNGRVSASSCTFCVAKSITDIIDPADFAAGARPACYMDVYVDAALVFQYGMTPPMPLFDVNSLPPESIEGLEVYSSAAQLPAKYNRSMGSGCGALLIWTRISPDKKP